MAGRMQIRSKVFRLCVVVVFVGVLEWATRPGRVEPGVEYKILEKTTERLVEKAGKVEKSITNLVKSLATAQEDGGKGVLETLRDKIMVEYDEADEVIRSGEDTLHAVDEKNCETLQEWVATIGAGCKITDGSEKTKKNNIPKHPIGGGDAEIDFDALESQQQAQPSSSSSYSDPCTTQPTTSKKCRQTAVKNAFLHAWNGYKTHSWGMDELKPITKTHRNWGDSEGIGLTIVDSLSSLWVLGCHDDFEDGVRWVEEEMKVDVEGKYSQFELVIRVVGGLLSAYEVSGEKHHVLIEKAAKLTDKIMATYQTDNGIPDSTINLRDEATSNSPWNSNSAILTEFTSIQLELRTLSYHTKNSYYDQAATYLTDLVDSKAPTDYLCPTHLDKDTAEWANGHVTLGAMGDSYYEYLLKQYLLTGKTEKRYKMMYRKAVAGITKKLFKRSEPSGDAYLAEMKKGSLYNKMDHLACFTGGMLSLGVAEHVTTKHADDAETLDDYADALADTCCKMYFTQETGLAPEFVMFRGGGDMEKPVKGAYSLLRPETVETLMYLYRFTGKEKYREKGWKIFTSIEKHCKIPSGGYTGIRDVGQDPPIPDDLQQSFLLSETFKYLFMLFSERDGSDSIDLSEWVLNTEGHPLRRRSRDPLDIWPESAIHRRETYLMKHGSDRVKAFVPIPVEKFDKKKFYDGKKKSGGEEEDSGSYEADGSSSGSGSSGEEEDKGTWAERLKRLRKKAENDDESGSEE